MATGGTAAVCNPAHLSPEELNVEFEVRGIVATAPDAFEKLAQVMRDEESKIVDRQFQHHTFSNPQLEFERLQQILAKIQDGLREVSVAPHLDREKAASLRSRMAHLCHRADRFCRAQQPHAEIETLKRAILLTAEAEMSVFERGNQLQSEPSKTSKDSQQPTTETENSAGGSSGPNAHPQPIPANNASDRHSNVSHPYVTTVDPELLFPPGRNMPPYTHATSSVHHGLVPPYPPPWRSTLPSMPFVRTQEEARRSANSVMSRWTVRYVGGPRDLPIDEFIFRVEDMAASAGLALEDMVGCFHVLLSDRAAEWFWGFRRNQRFATWHIFKEAIKKKFSSCDTDEEIRTMMGQRTQKAGERFDDFCRSIEALSHRLRDPLPEYNIISLLKANADPQLRRVLHMHDIRSVEQLQDVCAEYEHMWVSRGVWRRARGVEEIQGSSQQMRTTRFDDLVRDFGSLGYEDHTYYAPTANDQQPYHQSLRGEEEVQELYTKEPICWNCDEKGHTYQDCEVASRNIFCYGCGTKNVYRPQCSKCAVNSQRRKVNVPPNSANPFTGTSTSSTDRQVSNRPDEKKGQSPNWRRHSPQQNHH